jgi:hypothetical protein
VSGRVVGLAPLSCFFGSSSPFVHFSFAPLILLVEVVALIIFADSKKKNIHVFHYIEVVSESHFVKGSLPNQITVYIYTLLLNDLRGA